jgi:hypothetical protein
MAITAASGDSLRQVLGQSAPGSPGTEKLSLTRSRGADLHACWPDSVHVWDGADLGFCA